MALLSLFKQFPDIREHEFPSVTSHDDRLSSLNYSLAESYWKTLHHRQHTYYTNLVDHPRLAKDEKFHRSSVQSLRETQPSSPVFGLHAVSTVPWNAYNLSGVSPWSAFSVINTQRTIDLSLVPLEEGSQLVGVSAFRIPNLSCNANESQVPYPSFSPTCHLTYENEVLLSQYQLPLSNVTKRQRVAVHNMDYLGNVHQPFPQTAVKQQALGLSYTPIYYSYLTMAVQLATSQSTHVGVREELELAIRTCPPNSYHIALIASVCYQLGYYDLAVEQYSLATKLQPNFADAYNNMGNAWGAMGRQEEASRCYLAALAWDERHPHALNNLGNIYRDNGDTTQAMALYSKCLKACPSLAAAHCNLAGIYREENCLHEAAAHFRAALAYDPKLVTAASGLGAVYRDMNRNEEAVKAFSIAASLQPYMPEHLANLGNALKDVGRLEDSVECHRMTLCLSPNMENTFSQLAHSMAMLCDWIQRDSTLQSLRKYLNRNLQQYRTTCVQLLKSIVDGSFFNDETVHEPKVSCIDASTIILNIMEGILYDCEEAALLRTVMKTLNAMELQLVATQLARKIIQIPLASVQPFHCLIYPISDDEFRLLSSTYAARAAASVAFSKVPLLYWKEPSLMKRLKVGYVSSDFLNHPYGHLTQSVYGFHKIGSSVECYCYSLSPSDGSVWRQKIENEAEHFRDISKLSAQDAASVIARDGIHVLVNANGYTRGAKTEIFALRPAPVQVAFMGFPGSLGASYIEYMISDIVASPPEFVQKCHTETLLYHPHTYFVSDHKQSSPRQPLMYTSVAGTTNANAKIPLQLTRERYGLPKSIHNGGDCTVLFANFNQLYKLDPSTLDVWCNIIRRVPGSKIWLLRFPVAAESRLLAEVKRRKMPTDRFVFTDVVPKEEHIARCGLADIFLDTPVCNAHTIATDALWSGLPIVTCPTVRLASRVAASILHAAGLDKLIARNMEEYEEIAVSLALDHERCLSIRNFLLSHRDVLPVFDTLRWTRNLEALFWQAWYHKSQCLSDRLVYGQDVYFNPALLNL
eukprot:jgi/Galph1/2793/GphlegSOOS_G1452.1